MNVATHILVGGALGSAASHLSGIDPLLMIAAGMIGGLFPELDFLYGEHRRTLHLPFLYLLASVPVLIVATFYPVAGLMALMLVSAGAHSFMDIFAGAELRSWDRSEWQEGAVYDHIRKKWISPRRIAYGGSINDNIIAFGSALYLFFSSWQLSVKAAAVALMGLSVLYSIGIRRFSDRYVGEFDTLNKYVRWRVKAFLRTLHS